jgi:hypothetical protein
MVPKAALGEARQLLDALDSKSAETREDDWQADSDD